MKAFVGLFLTNCTNLEVSLIKFLIWTSVSTNFLGLKVGHFSNEINVFLPILCHNSSAKCGVIGCMNKSNVSNTWFNIFLLGVDVLFKYHFISVINSK